MSALGPMGRDRALGRRLATGGGLLVVGGSLLGIVVTAIRVANAFQAADRPDADPANKAKVLAGSISAAMNFLVAGAVVSLVGIVVAGAGIALLIRARRAAAEEPRVPS